MRLSAKYTNDTDYGRDEVRIWDVEVIGFVFGQTEDMSRRHGSHPAQALAICLFEDGKIDTVRLTQLRIKQVDYIEPRICRTKSAAEDQGESE